MLAATLAASYAALFAAPPAVAAPITHEETVTGTGSGSSVSTATSVAAVPGDLYLVAVSTKPFREVASVAGMGLSWNRLASQCGGREQAGVSLWQAQGAGGGSGPVTASLASSADNAVITVTRYSGADAANPVTATVSANPNGVDGACSGGDDDDEYSFEMPAVPGDAVVYAAISHRHRAHDPAGEFVERVEVSRGSGGDAASLSVVDLATLSTETVTVAGTFSGVVDWAAAAVAIRPSGAGGSSIDLATSGLGAVFLAPPGGAYDRDQRVALIANPIPGWRFDRWEGDLTGSTNPDTVTVVPGLRITAVFSELPRRRVDVTAAGAGEIVLSPPGGEYPDGATVGLTAQPAPGWRFDAWSERPDTSNAIVLDLEGDVMITAAFVPDVAGDAAFGDVVGGSSSGEASVSTTVDVSAVDGDLYLAAISTRPPRSVTSVAGLGLEWTPVAEQCGGRSQSAVVVWSACGEAGADGPVTAGLAGGADHGTIAVARYAGVNPGAPIGVTATANSNGSAGACDGGQDGTSYSFGLTAGAGSVVFAAISHRHRTHSEGAGFFERLELSQGSGGEVASVSVVDRSVDADGAVTVEGTFSGDVDWAGVAIEVRPGVGPGMHLLRTGTSGLGSVRVDPPAAYHPGGTTVVLTAVPREGWELETWSGGLSGSTNPVTLTVMDDVDASAHFVPSDLVTLRRRTIGAGTVLLDEPGGTYAPGTVVTATAVPRPDWFFVRWGGAVTGGANPTTLTATEDGDVVAFFSYRGERPEGLWTSAGELAARPLTGTAWQCLVEAADTPFVPASLDRASDDNIRCLAAAIAYARTGIEHYRRRVVAACSTLAAGGSPGDESLAWAREIGAYALAADLVGYRTPELDDWFRNVAEVWVAADGRTITEMFRDRPNNWGTNAFGMLVAVYAYLGDSASLNDVRETWRRGVEGPDPGFDWGERSWHVDPADPRQINPPGAFREGLSLDGALPDDVRRGGPFSNPPERTGYPWGALQGLVMGARILERYDPWLSVWHVGDDAIFRAARLLQVEWEDVFGGWAAEGDDRWMLPFLDHAYGTEWATGHPGEWGAGKNTGWAYVLLPPAVETGVPTVDVFRTGTRLRQSAPNPFASGTSIRWSLARGGRVVLSVHDVTGRLVATLLDDFRAAGDHATRWSGVDARGRPVANGVYWARLRANGRHEAIKITVVR